MIFEIIKNIKDSVGDVVFMAIGSTILSAPVWVYLKFKNRRGCRFSKISEEIISAILNEIFELENSGLNLKSKIIIKIKLHQIGIYIP